MRRGQLRQPRRAVERRLSTAEHSPLAYALDVLAHLQRHAERRLEVAPSASSASSARAHVIVSPTPGSL